MKRELSTLRPNPLSVAIYGEEVVDAALVESIRASGLLVPLTVREDGVIISGHRRFRAACAAGLDCVPTVVAAFEDQLDERLAIIEHNRQREKTVTQRMREGEELEKIERQKAKDRQGRRTDLTGNIPPNSAECCVGETREKVSAVVGMKRDKYVKAKAVYERAKEGMPEAVKQLKRLDEGASIHSAYMRVREAEKEQQRDELRKQAEEAAPVKYSNVIVGDFREVADQIGDGTVSLIFTDPPYDHEASEMLPDLAAFAERKLAEGGSLLCYIGQTQLPAAMDAFRERLRYWWTVACVHSGAANLMNKYGVRAGWKPVLWFVKGTRHEVSNIVSDVMSGGQEKDRHRWQQAVGEAEYWIDKLCPADGLVCDPFLGSGTTALAAQRLKRRWVGIEIDAATAAESRQRIAEAKFSGAAPAPAPHHHGRPAGSR